ncbi:MAG TPA: HNH endonuclease signature motif containing protein [Acidimicrobiales bacterium]
MAGTASANAGATASSSATTTSQTLRQALASVRTQLEGLSEVLSSADVGAVAEIVSCFDALGRASSAGLALAAHRGAELEAHSLSGHRNAADWLAHVSGIPHARAVDWLALADRVALSPPVQTAFVHGELSSAQAETMGEVLTVVPSCGPELLRHAKDGSHRDLDRYALRVKQAARRREQEQARRARAHRRRSLRFCLLPEGGVRVQIYLTEESWGKCFPALDHRTETLFRRGRSAKVHSSRDQYMADAFVDIVSGRAAAEDGGGGARSSITTVVRVDATALRRGSLDPGEMCEIAGVGPVSVATARDLLGESWVKLLVVDGADVTTITSPTRHVPARVEAALFERDIECVVPGCTVGVGLQTHHWRVDFSPGGPTQLDNLCRLCTVHHDLVTTGCWKLTGGPGQWTWSAPDFPVSPRLQASRRRVAAARGRSPSD